jgi:hypothetical protein
MKAKHVILPFIIGIIASLADSWLFSNLWPALDWRRPIAEWLAGLGFPTLAGWFGLFWIRIPTFVIAAILGVVVAWLFAARWILAVCFSALGFVGTSFVLMGWFVASMPSSASGWSIALKAEAWSVVSVLLVLVGAWLYVRRHAAKTTH